MNHPEETGKLGMRMIDADARITVQCFDPMNEEYTEKEMTVAEALDYCSVEGCPPMVNNHPEETGKLGKLVFPAVIRKYPGGVWVEFPDLAGCFTEGDTYAEAMERAETVLGAYINTMMERGIEIPAASDARNVKCGLGCVALFEVDLDIIARDGDLGSGAVSHYYPGRQGF